MRVPFFSAVLGALALCVAAGPGCSDRKAEIPPNGTADDGGGLPEDDASLPPPPKGQVAIAAYNVRAFFDTVCDTGACGPSDFEQALTAAQFKTKADGIAGGIKRLNADVVLLEEVENQTCLDALKTRLPQYPSAHIGETNFNGSVDVAIMAKDPIKAVKTHRQDQITLPNGQKDRFTREFLEIDLEHDGVPYTVFGAHFKSKNNDDPNLRLGEAQAARLIVLARAKAEPARLIVMGGDLNDSPGSPPINALEVKSADGQLVRVEARDLSADQQMSYFGGSFSSAIDHLLIPAPIVEYHVKGTTRIVGDSSNRGLGGSDHAAIIANFRFAVP